jgi:hypothetical protein
MFALIRVAQAVVWVRGNYTVLSVADDLASMTLLAGNLTFGSHIAPVPASYTATSGAQGLWGSYDELALVDSHGDSMFKVCYYAEVDAFTFERAYDDNASAVFPLFVSTDNAELSLIAWIEKYMLPGKFVPSLDVCASGGTSEGTDSACDLTGEVSSSFNVEARVECTAFNAFFVFPRRCYGMSLAVVLRSCQRYTKRLTGVRARRSFTVRLLLNVWLSC